MLLLYKTFTPLLISQRALSPILLYNWKSLRITLTNFFLPQYLYKGSTDHCHMNQCSRYSFSVSFICACCGTIFVLCLCQAVDDVILWHFITMIIKIMYNIDQLEIVPSQFYRLSIHSEWIFPNKCLSWPCFLY